MNLYYAFNRRTHFLPSTSVTWSLEYSFFSGWWWVNSAGFLPIGDFGTKYQLYLFSHFSQFYSSIYVIWKWDDGCIKVCTLVDLKAHGTLCVQQKNYAFCNYHKTVLVSSVNIIGCMLKFLFTRFFRKYLTSSFFSIWGAYWKLLLALNIKYK